MTVYCWYGLAGIASCACNFQKFRFFYSKMAQTKHNNLQSTIEANEKVVDFLDITLNMRTAIYKPYKKQKSNLTYIHKQVNHPPSIIKNLPKSINKRLSTNSENAQIFIIQ